MTQEIEIKYLIASKNNVRRTASKLGIDELKASILAHGLMQNLIVVSKGDKFEVIAGNRRLQAMNELIAEGKLKKEFTVNCRVDTAGNNDEISIAENIVREAMHPADEFEAFAALLATKKLTVSQVALRFGCTANHVERRMKLGNVSPVIMNAFREDKLDLECVMAFTIDIDHKKQEAVFKSLRNNWDRRPDNIKSLLTDKKIDADNKFAKFVGKDAYVKAGGTITSDLFSKDQYYDNAALITKLANEKMTAKAEALKKAGWGFVQIGQDSNWDFCSKFERLSKAPAKDQLKNYGIFMYVDYDGKIEQQMLKKGKESAAALNKAEKKKAKPAMSQSLTTDLSTYRMEIAQACLANCPSVAFDLLVFQAASSIGLPDYASGRQDYASVSFSTQYAPEAITKEKTDAKGLSKEAAEGVNFTWKKEKTEIDRFRALCKLKQDEKIALLALAYSKTIRPCLNSKPDVFEVAMTMTDDQVNKFWRPTKENYFSRITTEQLQKIGKELFLKDWNPKSDKKSFLAQHLHDVFSFPSKASTSQDTVKRIEAWLPEGMAFIASDGNSKKKAA